MAFWHKRRAGIGFGQFDRDEDGLGSSGTKDQAGAKVFISYSRKDLGFVDRLEAELRARGVEPLIDRSEIYAFEDWWQRIQGLIAAADTIVVVLSPDSVSSSICGREIAFAEGLNKRFAPIVARRVADVGAVPEALGRLNFVFLDGEGDHAAELDRLVAALGTDIDWVRRHSEYGAQALRWVEAGRPTGLLLRASPLDAAESWIARRPANAPVPTDATQAFVVASRRAATRRRNLLSGALAFGLIVAVALASVAYWQRQIAETQTTLAIEREGEARREKEEAERQRARAESQTQRAETSLAATKTALDGLVFDIAAGLRGRGLPITTVRAVLERAQALIKQLFDTKTDNYDFDLARSEVSMLIEFARTYASVGDVDRQYTTAQRAVDISEILLRTQPKVTLNGYYLAGALAVSADALLRAGALAGAAERYRRGREVLEHLVADYPNMALPALELAATLIRIGEVELLSGRPGAALPLLRESLERAGVVTTNPREIRGRVLQAEATGRIGDALADKDDPAGALARYREALAAMQGLASGEPGNFDYTVAIAALGDRMARTLVETGDPGGAEAQARQTLATLERLTEADRTNADIAQALASVALGLGDARLAANDTTDALASFRRARAILARLSAADPLNTFFDTGLGDADERIAAALRATGDLDGAVSALRDSLSRRERLVAAAPPDARLSRKLGATLNALAVLLFARHETEAALAHYVRALEIFGGYYKEDTANVRYALDVAATADGMGDVCVERRDLPNAELGYRLTLAMREQVATSAPASAKRARDWLEAFRKLGVVEREAGHAQAACATLRRGIAAGRTVRDRLPASATLETEADRITAEATGCAAAADVQP